MSSNTRFAAAALIIALSLVACSSGDTSLRMAPEAQSLQTASHIKGGGFGCRTLPFVNAKTLGLDARPRENLSRSDCGIRNVREMARRAHAGHFQVFDVPGAIQVSNCSVYEIFDDCGTFGIAINASGTIAGYYRNGSDVIASFVRSTGGRFTPFQAPSDQNTFSYDIVDGGAIAGQSIDAAGISQGFIRNKGGSFVRYQAPWASQIPSADVPQGTSTGMVNADGESAGVYFDSQGVIHGFIRHRSGSFAQVFADGSVANSICIVCLNDRGTSAGNYTGSDGIVRGFVRSAAGTITTVAPPDAVATLFSGINNGNRSTGFYVDQNSVVWGIITGGNKRQVVFQDPHASQTYGNGTQPEAINDAGAVTGLYSDDQGVVHGFYRSAAGEYSEFDPPGSVFTEPFSINASGTVTGYWYDAQGANHGFIWRPR